MDDAQETHSAEFFIVVASGEKELERFFVTKSSGPCQGCVPLRTGVRIPHVRSLYESLDEKEIVLCGRMRSCGDECENTCL